MSKEFTVMKTTLFGGFKKSDVLAYVEQLQTETADIKSMLDTKREESLELKRKIDELEVKLENLTQVNEKLSEKEKEVSELTVKLELALAENKKYSEQIADFDEKSEKLRRAEKQIGAAYIDARRYSDDLVDNAKAKAKDIGAIASQDVKREANEIEQLLKDVDAISKKFNSSLEQLHKDVYALGTKLNTSASTLLNLHTDLTGIEEQNFDFDMEDETNFTVISYNEHIDFDDEVKEG
ncbi:MAG: hypothetical protein E7528_03270 [Ruminococcaceae bacterium]|nr:hypothetical protein [Oscillospiraceae bacterium]